MSAGSDLLSTIAYCTPPVRYVPSWFPFVTFRRQIKEWQRLGDSYKDEPFEFVQKQMVSLPVAILIRSLVLIRY